MPFVITKSVRKPKKIDARIPEKDLRRELNLTARHEPTFARAYLKLVRNLVDEPSKRRLLDAIGDLYAGRATIEEVMQAIEWFNPADPLAAKRWMLLSDSIRSAYATTMEDAGEAEMRSAGIPMRFRVEKQVTADIRVPQNPFSDRWMRNQSGRLIAQINADTQQVVRTMLATGFERGTRPKQLVQEIADRVGLTEREWRAVENREALLISQGVPEAKRKKMVERYTKQLLVKRGQRIARTETLEAYNQGLADSWLLAKEEGLIEPNAMKEWVEITASDRTCEICRGLGRQRVPVDEPFVSDTIGEIMRPPAHPHCRCSMSLVEPDDPAEEAFSMNDVLAARDTLAARG